MFVVCCVIVVVACVADKLLLRTLRACAVLPVNVSSHRLHDVTDDVALPGGQSCDGRPFANTEAVMASPLKKMHLLQFSETKV